jgi:hypothetical protein
MLNRSLLTNQFLNILSEIGLYSFLIMLPFSCSEMNIRIIILFIILISSYISFSIFYKIDIINIQVWTVIFTIILLIIFNIVENINFIKQFNFTIELSQRISLSTIMLSVAVLSRSLNVLISGKINIRIHPLLKYFIFGSVLLFVFMLILCPVFWIHYNINIHSNIQLANKLLKYLMIIFLVADYVADFKKVKMLNYCIITSLALYIISNFS